MDNRLAFPSTSIGPVLAIDPVTQRRLTGFPVPAGVLAATDGRDLVGMLVERALTISHPSLVPLYGLAAGKAQTWIVCETPEGESLAEMMLRDPKATGEFAFVSHLAQQIGLTLWSLHRTCGIGHGNLTERQIYSADGRNFFIVGYGVGHLIDAESNAGTRCTSDPAQDIVSYVRLLATLLSPPGEPGPDHLNERRRKARWSRIPEPWAEAITEWTRSAAPPPAFEVIFARLSLHRGDDADLPRREISRKIDSLPRIRSLAAEHEPETPFQNLRRTRLLLDSKLRDARLLAERETELSRRTASLAGAEGEIARRSYALDEVMKRHHQAVEELAVRERRFAADEEALRQRLATLRALETEAQGRAHAFVEREHGISSRELEVQRTEARCLETQTSLHQQQAQLMRAKQELAEQQRAGEKKEMELRQRESLVEARARDEQQQAEASSQFAARERAEIEQRLGRERSELQEKFAAVQQEAERVRTLELALQTRAAQVQQNEDAVRSRESAVAEKEQRLMSATATDTPTTTSRSDVEDRCRKLEQENVRLTQASIDATANADRLAREFAGLVSRTAELRKGVTAVEAERNSLNEALRKARTDSAAGHATTEQLTKSRDEALRAAESARRAIEDEKARHRTAAADVARLNETLRGLAERASSAGTLQAELDSARATIAALQAEVDRLSAQSPTSKSADAPKGKSVPLRTIVGVVLLAVIGASWSALAAKRNPSGSASMRSTGDVIVNASPAGTMVEVDGRPPKPVPGVMRDLRPGLYQAVLRAPGLPPKEITFAVKANEVTETEPVDLAASATSAMPR